MTFIKTTEQTSKYEHLEKMSVQELLFNINQEDKTVPFAVEKALPQISLLVAQIVAKMQLGGRLFYIGAGTSGRLGIVDASECPPTFGVPFDLVNGIIAGGDKAIRRAVENAEDNPKQAWIDLQEHSISENDLIFRIMTFDHIPLHPERKKTVKTVADAHAKVNFPPFQHWKFNDIKELVCVGKSHWDGDLDTGRFSTSKGQMSNLLGKMLMKLAERYSSRSNVRGYTYVDEMRGQAVLQLTQVALQFDESKSSNPFSFYTQCCTNAFLRVINIEKRNREIRVDILEIAGLNPSHTRMNSDTYGEKMNDGYTWIDVD